MFNNKGSLDLSYRVAEKFLKAIDRESYLDEFKLELSKQDLISFSGMEAYLGHLWSIYEDYLLETVCNHKIAVFNEGVKLKDWVVLSDEEWERQLIFHDMSKFTHQESYYAWKFCEKTGIIQGTKDNPIDFKDSKTVKDGFRRSWFHHKANNPHHPEYWHTVERNGEVSHTYPMERKYAIEMLADWAGASATYGTGLQTWIDCNIKKFKFHKDTLSFISIPLAKLYGIPIDTHDIMTSK